MLSGNVLVRVRRGRLAWPLAACCLAACTETATIPPSEMPSGLAQCVEPRPQLCTQDYRPVCGLRDTGVRCVTTPCESTERLTYGNACSACSNPDVLGYTDGMCEE